MAELLFLGVIVSIAFYELIDITPGGIIVPGLMVVYIGQPLKMLYTVVISVIAYFIVNLMSRRFLVFGKRRFVLMIIICLILHVLLNLIFGSFIGSLGKSTMSLVGYTVAGIIANNMYKQGVVKTASSLAVTVCFIELIVLLLSAVGILL